MFNNDRLILGALLLVMVSVGMGVSYLSSRESPGVATPADYRKAAVAHWLKQQKPSKSSDQQTTEIATPRELIPTGPNTISGKITDESGAPVEGVYISFSGEAQYWSSANATTNKSGDYVVQVPLNDTYEMYYRSELHAPGGLTGIAAGTENLNVLLHSLGSISAKVVDPEGQLLPIFRLALETHVFQHYDRRFDQIYHETGAFTFEDVQPETEYFIYGRAEGFADMVVPVVTPAAGESLEGVVVRMEKGHALLGRVIDTRREPVAGVRIFHGFTPKNHGYFRTAEIETDGDGLFEIPNLPAGQLGVSAWKTGYINDLKEVAIAAPQNEIELVLSDGAVIAGQVTVAGEPASNAFILGSIGDIGNDRRSFHGKPDLDGRFLITGVNGGSGDIEAHIRMGPTGKIFMRKKLEAVDKVKSVVDFHFYAGTSSVGGFVRSSDAEAVTAIVELEIRSGTTTEFLATDTDSEGRYLFENVPAGKIRLVVKARTLGAHKFVLGTLKENDQLRLDIQVDQGSTVIASVLNTPEAVRYEAFLMPSTYSPPVWLSEQEQTRLREIHLGSQDLHNGEATFENVDRGSYLVVVTAIPIPSLVEGAEKRIPAISNKIVVGDEAIVEVELAF